MCDEILNNMFIIRNTVSPPKHNNFTYLSYKHPIKLWELFLVFL